MKRNRLAAAVLAFAVAVFVAAQASAQSDSPPITRGEMAVFLAKALGLHWPWDAP
jgi:hypothetical protein